MEIKKRYLQENNLVLILIFVESAEHAALKIRKKKRIRMRKQENH